jgi:hypothetical protein
MQTAKCMYVFSYLALFGDSCHRYCLIYRVTFTIRFELATKNYLDMSDNVKSQSKLIQKSLSAALRDQGSDQNRELLPLF